MSEKCVLEKWNLLVITTILHCKLTSKCLSIHFLLSQYLDDKPKKKQVFSSLTKQLLLYYKTIHPCNVLTMAIFKKTLEKHSHTMITHKN